MTCVVDVLLIIIAVMVHIKHGHSQKKKKKIEHLLLCTIFIQAVSKYYK